MLEGRLHILLEVDYSTFVTHRSAVIGGTEYSYALVVMHEIIAYEWKKG